MSVERDPGRPKPIGNRLPRPPHWPPACPTCDGFSWLASGMGYKACPSCREHPGNAMTFQDWTIERMRG